jgi:hypothetical protein
MGEAQQRVGSGIGFPAERVMMKQRSLMRDPDLGEV